MGAADVLRSLVKEIVLTPDPESGALQIEVHGDLAGILTIALERKKPADGAGGVQFVLVAGTGFANCFAISKAIIPPCPAKAA